MVGWLLAPALLALAVRALPPELASSAYYVPRLPGLPEDPIKRLHVYSGHIASDPKAATEPATTVSPHIFYVLVRARKSADKERVIFWFNGGPGCSSFDGLMMEIGPWRVDNKGGLKYVDGGWEEYANVVYVDQPPGTGLSYTPSDKLVHELGEASSHVLQFMRTFYDIFPEFKYVDTYLAGESYAGQFIPYFADAILNSNLPTPLQGVAIGNGWIDPLTQYPAYVDFAVTKGLIKTGTSDHTRAVKMAEKCVTDLKSMKIMPTATPECESIMGTLTQGLQRSIDGKQVCMNVYDIRLVDDYPACGMNWPPDLNDIKPYLRRRDVVDALHASAKSEAWMECNGRVGSALRNRNSAASISLFPSLLDKIKVMLFAGDQDYICNHIGIEALIKGLTWKNAQGLDNATSVEWTVNGTAAGTWTESRGLTYVKVYNSSHMVPYDVPHVAHDMMLRFMGVDFTQIASGSAKIPSNVGNDTKAVVQPSTDIATSPPADAPPSPEDEKAKWDAYYNAGSIALVFVLIALSIGLFLFCRNRRRKTMVLRNVPDEEENIPLTRSESLRDKDESDDEWRRRKGKGRAVQLPGTPLPETVFDVGDDDDDEGHHEKR
ncbi:carboxypeptidase KEX1 [Exidia glandulosa HHB12029]|uniref:Carboxypeptidase n=1 Tax=Exidia glandulosa HHB12029 TaxID=1314781 RepID=A0A165QWC3_EXIGL|nr:carboxypeptidase KEX1 [Exidia glandulosa HHB12029]